MHLLFGIELEISVEFTYQATIAGAPGNCSQMTPCLFEPNVKSKY